MSLRAQYLADLKDGKDVSGHDGRPEVDERWPLMRTGLAAGTCDRLTEEEARAGKSTRLLLHRWPNRPVKIGDRCECGERTADVVLAAVLQ